MIVVSTADLGPNMMQYYFHIRTGFLSKTYVFW